MPHLIGVSLVLGFIFMLIVDQVFSSVDFIFDLILDSESPMLSNAKTLSSIALIFIQKV